MRTTFTLLCSVLLLGAATIARAQYEVGPIYSENPRSSQYGSPGSNPFRLNWSTGRFDYVPVPYAPQASGSDYDPYRFNAFIGRWDYVPLTLRPSAAQQPASAAVNINPAAPASPYMQTAPPPPPPQVSPADMLPNQGEMPGIVNYYYSPVRAPAPTTAPSTAPAKPEIAGGNNHIVAPRSAAPSTRPSGETASSGR